MTPSNLKKNSHATYNGEEGDEARMIDLLAKQAFMKVDDKTLKAFRNQGKTPTLKSSPYNEKDMLRSGDLPSSLVKPTSLSPLSHRTSGMGSTQIGYMGTVQDVSCNSAIIRSCSLC